VRRIEPLVIAGVPFASRLLAGTGKFPGPEVMARAIRASGAELVTVALRRVDLSGGPDPTLAALEPLDARLLPNTSGARDSAARRPARRGSSSR